MSSPLPSPIVLLQVRLNPAGSNESLPIAEEDMNNLAQKDSVSQQKKDLAVPTITNDTSVPSSGIEKNAQEEKNTCAICLLESPISEMFISTSACTCTYCQQCLQAYLLSLMQDGKFLSYKCPNDQCEQQLTGSDVRRHLNNEALFNKYKRYRKQAIMAQDPSVRWCTTADCDTALRRGEKSLSSAAQTIQLDSNNTDSNNNNNNEGSQVILECHKCRARVCFACGQNEHLGKTCQEAQDPSLTQFCNTEDIRRCPRCLQLIQRTKGCQYMTCTVCRYNFCYICLQPCSHAHICFGWASSLQVKNGNCGQKTCYYLVYSIEKFIGGFIFFLTMLMFTISIILLYHIFGPVGLGLKLFEGSFQNLVTQKFGHNVGIAIIYILIFILYPILLVLMIFPGYFVTLGLWIKHLLVELPAQEQAMQWQKKQHIKTEFQLNYQEAQQIVDKNLNNILNSSPDRMEQSQSANEAAVNEAQDHLKINMPEQQLKLSELQQIDQQVVVIQVQEEKQSN